MSYLEDESEETGVANLINRSKYYLDGSHDELVGRREKYKINYCLKHGLELVLIPSFLIHIGTRTKDHLDTFKPVIEDFVWALYLSGMRFLHYRTGKGNNKEVVEEKLPSDKKLIENILSRLSKTCNPKSKKIGGNYVKVPNLKFCDDSTHCRDGQIGEIRGVLATECIIEYRHWLVGKIGEKLGDPNFGLELVYEEDDESLIEEFSDDEMEDFNDNEMEDSNDSRVRFYAPGGKVEITWEEQKANLHVAVDQLHSITVSLSGHFQHTKCTIKVEESLRKLLKSYIGDKVFRMRDFFLNVPKTILLELHSNMIKRGVANGIFVMADDGRTPEGDECLLVKNNVEGNRPELGVNYYNDNEKKRYHHCCLEFQVFAALFHPDQNIAHRYEGQPWATALTASHTCKRKSCIGSHICSESQFENNDRELCYGWIDDGGVLNEHCGCKHSPRCVNILYINQS